MVRPIDINLNIQHASDMARMGATENQGRPEVAAQQYADRMEKQVRQQQEQVHRHDPSDRANVNPDGKGHGGGYNPKRKIMQKKEEEKKKTPKKMGDNLLDIRI
ncbi:MAG: hypothetical protein FWE90_00210 [Defluviitaleaceae bacterium]|nr:hypothetical protein [Defluviitaleaceae bacterium]